MASSALDPNPDSTDLQANTWHAMPRHARNRQAAAFVIGFVIPVLAIIGVTSAIGGLHVDVLGMPLLFFWIFLCFPLTTLCLWASSRIRGEHDDDNKGGV